MIVSHLFVSVCQLFSLVVWCFPTRQSRSILDRQVLSWLRITTLFTPSLPRSHPRQPFFRPLSDVVLQCSSRLSSRTGPLLQFGRVISTGVLLRFDFGSGVRRSENVEEGTQLGRSGSKPFENGRIPDWRDTSATHHSTYLTDYFLEVGHGVRPFFISPVPPLIKVYFP